MKEALKKVREAAQQAAPSYQYPLPPMTSQEAEELREAAIEWAAQGHRSKWVAYPSLKLWDLVQKLKG